MVSDETIRQYERTLDENEPIERTVRRLRDDGLSRLEAIRVLLSVLDLSLAEAKRVLVTSDTWAEARAEANNAPSTPPSSGSTEPPPAPG